MCVLKLEDQNIYGTAPNIQEVYLVPHYLATYLCVGGVPTALGQALGQNGNRRPVHVQDEILAEHVT